MNTKGGTNQLLAAKRILLSSAGRPLLFVLLLCVILTANATSSWAQITNNVTGANGLSDYIINGQLDPPLTLQRGATYYFALSNISTHPFFIKYALGNGSAGRYDTGVTNNGATSGTLIFAVPPDAPDQLFYQCSAHFNMNGPLNIVNPPTPPPFQILELSIGDQIILRHTATNSFTYTPEFVTNVASTNWTPLNVLSSVSANGTNEVICGKPDAAQVFIRVQAQ